MKIEAKRPIPTAAVDELVRRAAAGAPGAFDELYYGYYDRVQRHLNAIVGPSADLDDLIQTTFIKVHQNLHRYRFEARFTTWLYRITVNVALGHLRKSGRRRSWEEQADLEWPEPREEKDGLDEVIDRRQRMALFYSLLDKLRPKKRVVFAMHVLEGRSIEEIAEVVQAPTNTVISRLRTARLELSKAMERRVKNPGLGLRPVECA